MAVCAFARRWTGRHWLCASKTTDPQLLASYSHGDRKADS